MACKRKLFNIVSMKVCVYEFRRYKNAYLRKRYKAAYLLSVSVWRGDFDILSGGLYSRITEVSRKSQHAGLCIEICV